MLGGEAVIAISSANEMTRIFSKFAQEMHGKSAETNSETFGAERAIDAYRQISKALHERSQKLLEILRRDRHVR